VLAEKQATLVIPIVFAAATDPLGGGLVASLARREDSVSPDRARAGRSPGIRAELMIIGRVGTV